MKYMGSKRRIAKYILPIILKGKKSENKHFYDMFVGGGNIIENVNGKRIGVDSNPFIIDALLSIRDNVFDLPKNKKDFTEYNYKKAKSNGHIYNGYISFALSYGGKFWGGWCRDKENKRDYVNESYRNAVVQSKKIQNVVFLNCNYDEIKIEQDSIIYCDPPYANTTKYKDDFDHEKFWQWCREKSIKGHQVFISEYNAPDDFVCLWSKEIVSSLTKDTGSKKSIEKLFIYKNKENK